MIYKARSLDGLIIIRAKTIKEAESIVREYFSEYRLEPIKANGETEILIHTGKIKNSNVLIVISSVAGLLAGVVAFIIFKKNAN